MILVLLVGAVSGFGAVARYALDTGITRRYGGRFPLGTLAVNVLGSLLLGLVTGLGVHQGFPTSPAVVLSAGFCSGFTTWSTYVWETLALVESDAALAAAANLLGSLSLGLAAAALGYGVALL